MGSPSPVTGAPAGEPLTGHMGRVSSVAFGTGPDGRLLLASGSADGTVRLWDQATRACIATLQRRSRVRSIAAARLALFVDYNQNARDRTIASAYY